MVLLHGELVTVKVYSEAHQMGWRAALYEPTRRNPFLDPASRAEWDAGYDAHSALLDEIEDQRRFSD